jgi:hypothetical protein
VRSRTPSEEQQNESTLLSHDYDRDLLDLLPPLHIIDAILDYYFEYCNWVYRHVNQRAFQIAWQKFKTGGYPDRIVLGTVAGVLAVCIRYLPPGHELLAGLSGSLVDEKYYLELSVEYYDVMKKALRRYQDETKVYTIELVELLLLRSHYLTFTKTDPEEIWTVRGQIVTIGTAMGLHRDPGKHRFSREAAERRRWAWWHIILHERSVLILLNLRAASSHPYFRCSGGKLFYLGDLYRSLHIILILNYHLIATQNLIHLVDSICLTLHFSDWPSSLVR